MASEVYGRCPNCTGPFFVGHVCPGAPPDPLDILRTDRDATRGPCSEDHSEWLMKKLNEARTALATAEREHVAAMAEQALARSEIAVRLGDALQRAQTAERLIALGLKWLDLKEPIIARSFLRGDREGDGDV